MDNLPSRFLRSQSIMEWDIGGFSVSRMSPVVSASAAEQARSAAKQGYVLRLYTPSTVACQVSFAARCACSLYTARLHIYARNIVRYHLLKVKYDTYLWLYAMNRLPGLFSSIAVWCRNYTHILTRDFVTPYYDCDRLLFGAHALLSVTSLAYLNRDLTPREPRFCDRLLFKANWFIISVSPLSSAPHQGPNSKKNR